MKDLIEAFTIFAKYGEVAYPTHCEHDIMYVYPYVGPSEFTAEELARLDELGFAPHDEFADGFYSYKYGSC